MKRLIVIFLIATVMQPALHAQLKVPAPSPTQTVKQDFGISSIELSYSRPGKKGRTIFGDVVPYGKVWRTGANQATTLTFGDEVTIGGTKIPAGKYGLLSMPGKDSWTLIITKQLDVTSAAAYKPENDVARVTAKPMAIKDNVETFTMEFANVTSNSCKLHLMWDKTAVSIPITTDVDSKVMAKIDEQMATEKPPYYAAASYYFDNGKDLTKAKQWAQKAAAADPKAYYVVHLLAKIQAKSGDKAGAIATAKKSIELSKEAKNDDYVRLNEKLIAGLK